ncbi:MAG: hypothetical protein IJV17_00320 [Prevotella sp.]|nr:hypothetical protein [Prevotella sp.]
MKKLMNLAYAGAIALLSMGLTACSSGDDAVVDNPNYNPTDNTVKAQLAISLGSGSGSQMRMANNIVQGQTTPVFRGMQDMRLIAFNKWVAKSEVDADATGTIKAFNDKVINLGSMSVFDKESQNAKVYSDLSIPVGTKAFLFYGRATRESATSYPTGATDADKSHLDKFHTGVLNAPASYTAAVKEYEFSLQPIQPGIYETTTDGVVTQHGVNERALELISYIKSIRAVTVSNVTLHSYLNAFQPTAGSSASIEAAVQDLWDKVCDVTVTTDAERADVAAIKAAILGTSRATIDETTNKVTIIMNKMLGYPANIFLPDGAAAIDWENPANPTPIVGGHNGTVYVAPLNSYVYPTELIYRANTTIGVSDDDKVSETYGEESWTDIINGQKYSWDGEVKGSTRSIALRSQIEYAVGRLDLQVKAAKGVLKDKEGNDVTVPTGGFPISAVLIGSQRNVNFQFDPISTSTHYTIYDREMTEPMAALNNAAQGTNKTLVLESGEDLTLVNVCVELTNTSGTSFVSKNGIVPAGAKFYLVGQLDLSKAGEYTGDNGSPKMIFKQDYITNVTFTIAELGTNDTGLGAAYNVIPDLKTPQLEVAFSVNLDWKPGLTFNKEF